MPVSYFVTGISPPGNVTEGHYKYMGDLLAFETTATDQGPQCFVPATPLIASAWQHALRTHPDRQFVDYILGGIGKGVHIGVDRATRLRPAQCGNLPSVHSLPTLVAQHIREEGAAGRLLGPLPPLLTRGCQVSPIGLIPKPHQPGKWRLIVDLSSPHGFSVNDAISVEHCHMHYTSVLEASALIRQLGRGARLAKIDLHQAYRMVPVHADDHHLLGIKYQNETFVDTALPFGLRSAPKIFSAFADALAWILHARGVVWQLHYLDDFLFLGAPTDNSCGRALDVALDTCGELGVPVAAHKTEGPASQLTFLGILVDTVTMSLSLPGDKLTRILGLVLSWRSKKTASKRELQSLIGHLSHAAMVVLPGRTFLRRMIDLMKVAKRPSHHVRLTAGLSDLQWWASFLPRWNGRSIMPPEAPSHVVTSDASGSWGCGAVTDSGQWFQVQWLESWGKITIAAKEMVPVVISIAIWEAQWTKCGVLVRSDNMAVVHCLTSGTARDPLLMHLLRCLHFATATHQIYIVARHVPGVLNTAADALSRNSMT